jgi:hypothetical protein
MKWVGSILCLVGEWNVTDSGNRRCEHTWDAKVMRE